MADKLAIVGASGKLGFATLSALLEHTLLPATQIVCTTSSDGGAEKLEPPRRKGVEVRSANWDDDQATWIEAYQGCSKLFLISSSRIDKDFNEAPPGKGRESDHFPVVEAARQAGIRHIYYTSLAFANPSLSRVMTAHERTEEYLKKTGLQYTIIREGLYNESWPLYFGHYDVPNDTRSEIVVAGDSKISWTSIPDLGLANAIVLAEPGDKYVGKTFYLAQHATKTLNDIAAMVSKARGKEVKLEVVSREEHEKHHVEEQGKPEPFIKWWSRTYAALRQNECEIDDPILEKLLASKEVKPKPMEETMQEMLA
ncbi:Putative NAD(P)-binding domain, NAD(P)-binding domain superfamily [Septoria linicola]|uniref:NAD(P)-binding domain, NAD(P)-binding domain superfamily n=1 Tax=Septoria linicola TaxID=215465 RepID=A0A9Q9AZV4_9PEZI|nr:Putative NAD(P)-binding domain, NAD(P)-binding domain superfamily [Septoria linicola]